jgi:alkanesulfonate monooxygenase SsuD/methylene tetrahydromethanopterin reductase-like flavin-dependent oxidoreductase (luciferase family)
MSEHHFIEDGYLPSVLPVAAAIAARTKRIRIAPGVLLMPFHNPMRLAEDIAVVDVISGGRLELGVGAGYKLEEFGSFGVPFNERGSRTNEALGIIRRLLEGETVTLKSEFLRSQERQGYPQNPSRNPTHLFGWAASPRRRSVVPSAMAMVSRCLTRTGMCMGATSPN